jgi:hypothetical protein
VTFSMHLIPTCSAQSTTKSRMINEFNGLEDALGIAVVDPWPECTDRWESASSNSARIGPNRTLLKVVLATRHRSYLTEVVWDCASG